jgi:8-oxo-dGTP pyrophosphatase MutT (NUDIX family)
MMTYYRTFAGCLSKKYFLYATILPMKILTEIHRSDGINMAGKTVHRIAVRAVILRGRELLMVYSANVGDYKFPGGGVGRGESHEQALARELYEECGAFMLGVEGELGAVIEYDFAEEKDFDVFKMTSHYYFCRVGDGFGSQKLDDYERDLGFKPIWMDVDKAISANCVLLDLQTPPEWLQREIFVLEYISKLI